MLKRLKLPKFFNGVARIFRHTIIWMSEEGQEFETFSKKCSFLNFEWEKTNLTTFDPQ